MNGMPIYKYQSFETVDLPDRTWPNQVITSAPIWCSVDLRDGNQSLQIPMNLKDKLRFFDLLVAIGFKEIEVGFPAASAIEFEFVRTLIKENRIPEDVTIQVLTQSKPQLIENTFAAVQGAKRVIYHLYNSTSTLQRRVVFGMDRSEITKIAVEGTQQIKAMASARPETEFIFQYSPESFTGTEPGYALEICEAVMAEWQPTPEKKAILNLPATVELSTPNVYADRIEWFCQHYSARESIIISLHTHNDRGTGVAATELGLLAGAERVEGTLFGCGERTGNVDIVNLALNLFSQGVDSGLDFSDINRAAVMYKECTGMPIHPRHPYVGELVYTAFSGSHQDAIKKGMDLCPDQAGQIWSVPYLPIDPRDVGRTYQKIIQINSQSGKGGIAYIMKDEFGFNLPKEMHGEFGRIVQKESEATGRNVCSATILQLFREEYIDLKHPFAFLACEIQTKDDKTAISTELMINDGRIFVQGSGNGPLDALADGFKKSGDLRFKLTTYSEHALEQSTSSTAAAYIGLKFGEETVFGVGIDANISIASVKAFISALNRALVQLEITDWQRMLKN